MLLCDFHVHTSASDGKLSLSDTIDLYGKSGFDAISITDHFCDRQSLLGVAAKYLNKTIYEKDFAKYIEQIQKEAYRAWQKYSMLVIPGVEITKNSFRHDQSSHVLGIGIDSYISPDMTIQQTCTAIRSQGGLAIAAHPVSTRKVEHQTYFLWNRREELRPYFDAWEVASGSILFEEVMQTDLPKIANSDLHTPQQIYSWKTLIPGEKSIENIFNCIKNQNLSFYFYKGGYH